MTEPKPDRSTQSPFRWLALSGWVSAAAYPQDMTQNQRSVHTPDIDRAGQDRPEIRNWKRGAAVTGASP